MDTVVPTRYRVSTVTATGHLNLGASLDLDSFYEGISISDDVVYARHKDDEKGVQRARDKPRRRMKGDDENKNNNDNKKKNFENQVTIVVKDAQRRVNVKVFSNGQVQLTGLLDVDHGPAIIERVAGIFPVDHRDDASIGPAARDPVQRDAGLLSQLLGVGGGLHTAPCQETGGLGKALASPESQRPLAL